MKTNTIPTNIFAQLEVENRRRHFLEVAQSFEDKANDPDFRIAEIEREHFRSEAARCRAIANVNPVKFAVVLGCYSLEKGEIGKPIGKPHITEYADGKSALKALLAVIEDDSTANTFHIRFPDGRLLPLNAAYTEIFGVPPVSLHNRPYKYPLF